MAPRSSKRHQSLREFEARPDEELSRQDTLTPCSPNYRILFGGNELFDMNEILFKCFGFNGQRQGLGVSGTNWAKIEHHKTIKPIAFSDSFYFGYGCIRFLLCRGAGVETNGQQFSLPQLSESKTPRIISGVGINVVTDRHDQSTFRSRCAGVRGLATGSRAARRAGARRTASRSAPCQPGGETVGRSSLCAGPWALNRRCEGP